jgi:hypothetical protein
MRGAAANPSRQGNPHRRTCSKRARIALFHIIAETYS